MITHQIGYEIYEASRSWAVFGKKKLSVNELLDWRLQLMSDLKLVVFDCQRIPIEYEIEATDKLLDKAQNIL